MKMRDFLENQKIPLYLAVEVVRDKYENAKGHLRCSINSVFFALFLGSGGTYLSIYLLQLKNLLIFGFVNLFTALIFVLIDIWRWKKGKPIYSLYKAINQLDINSQFQELLNK